MSTLRYARPQKAQHILEYKKPTIIEGETKTTPITILDQFFEFDKHPHFWPTNPREISLEKTKHWDTVRALLEKHSIKTTTKQTITEVITTYQLPIIGVSNTPLCQRVTWKGIVYKLDSKYFREADTFRELPPFSYATHPRLSGKITADTKIHPGLTMVSTHLIYGIPSEPSGSPNAPAKRIEIDLGKDVQVTHLSTMGKRFLFQRFPNDSKEIQKLNPPPTLRINYVDEQEKHWLSEYIVEVRVDNGKKWLLIGTFLGNTNRFREVVHAIDCVPIRFIRITPKKWVGSTDCQIGVFGTKSTELEPKPKTVEYSIIIQRFKKQVPYGYSDSGYSWKDKSTRHALRRETSRLNKKVSLKYLFKI